MKNTALGFLCGVIVTSALYTFNGQRSSLSASLIYDPAIEASIAQDEALVIQYEALEKATNELVAIEAKQANAEKKKEAVKDEK